MLWRRKQNKKDIQSVYCQVLRLASQKTGGQGGTSEAAGYRTTGKKSNDRKGIGEAAQTVQAEPTGGAGNTESEVG